MVQARDIPKRVVAALDGGDGGRRALERAISEAARHHAPLDIVHCAREGSAGPMLDEAAERAVERLPAPRVNQRTLTGERAPALRSAVEHDDLLVLGLRTRRRLTARVLGSTTSRLLANPPSALAVVPPPLEEPPPDGPFGGHVAAAVDGPASARHVLPWAFSQARAHELPLVAVHAEPSPDHPAGAYVDQRMLEISLSPLPESLGMLEDALAPWRREHPELTLRRGYFHGSPAEVLRHVCGNAELLVLGAPGRGPRPLHLADRVLARTACPVLVGVAPESR